MTQLLHQPMMHYRLKTSPSSSQTKLARFGRKPMALQTQNMQATPMPASACFNRQPPNNSRSCSNQALFIRPCSNVADKKHCASLLLPFLSVLFMFNRSLEKAYLPISQKAAIIDSLIKKRGLDTEDRKNYRPVSNVTFVSKLL